MKKRKIIYITDEILVENNAPTIHVLEICKNLRKLGFLVTLFAPSLSEIKTNKLHIKYIFMIKKIRSLFFHPLLLLSLLYELSKDRNVIVYIRYFPLLILPIFLCKTLRVPFILEINGKIAEETKLLNESFLAKIYTCLDRINLKQATTIIAVTDGLKKHLVQKYNIPQDLIYVIENGVDAKAFQPMNKKKSQAKVQLRTDKIYIGYVGSLYEYQGIDDIIKSAKQVTSQVKNVQFIIIGNGTEKERTKVVEKIARYKLEKAITLLGPINHKNIPEYINAFDICLCYPTPFRDNATSPFKLFEYLACGKAVIASDLEGFQRMFKDKVLFAKPNDSSALAEKIIYLLTHKIERNKLEKNSRKFILNGYSWENVTKKIAFIMKKI